MNKPLIYSAKGSGELKITDAVADTYVFPGGRNGHLPSCIDDAIREKYTDDVKAAKGIVWATQTYDGKWIVAIICRDHGRAPVNEVVFKKGLEKISDKPPVKDGRVAVPRYIPNVGMVGLTVIPCAISFSRKVHFWAENPVSELEETPVDESPPDDVTEPETDDDWVDLTDEIIPTTPEVSEKVPQWTCMPLGCNAGFHSPEEYSAHILTCEVRKKRNEGLGKRDGLEARLDDVELDIEERFKTAGEELTTRLETIKNSIGVMFESVNLQIANLSKNPQIAEPDGSYETSFTIINRELRTILMRGIDDGISSDEIKALIDTIDDVGKVAYAIIGPPEEEVDA